MTRRAMDPVIPVVINYSGFKDNSTNNTFL